MAVSDPVTLGSEYPLRASIHKMMDQNPLPVIAPGIIDAASFTADAVTRQAAIVVDELNAALASDDTTALEGAFFTKQAYFKDTLAMTGHYRTFTRADIIAPTLLELCKLRGFDGVFKFQTAQFVPVSPVLQFIDVRVSFKTTAPAATSSAMILLLPTKSDVDEAIQWKIWILSTKLENLDVHPEDESLLGLPGRKLDGLDNIESSVVIIGGGNGAIALAARLKALGVESVLLERNARPGDNWGLRYDCMRFHLPTQFCDLPYMPYGPEFHAPHLLNKDELAAHVRKYVAAFDLNVVYSAKVRLTTYDQKARTWSIKFETPLGQRTATAKHLVLATGIGSQKPYLPPIPGRDLYKGISVHSVAFKSGYELKNQGAQSVLVVGSANTAFDVMEDCHRAGLQTTINVRSPTYLLPLEYLCDKRALGAYEDGVESADRRYLTLPTCVDSQLSRGLFRLLASQDPDRYKPLAAAGFPVISSDNPEASLMSNLLERAGGHYIDMGSTQLIADGTVGLKANVEPVEYTETGMRFSDGSTIDVDAIVWATGFADKDVRKTVAEILGGETETVAKRGLLGPRDVAARVDATWGLDSEGEIRGMWKRHLHLDNFWIMGGYTQLHRWHSRNLALQIKADLIGALPPAYRKMPCSRDQN